MAISGLHLVRREGPKPTLGITTFIVYERRKAEYRPRKGRNIDPRNIAGAEHRAHPICSGEVVPAPIQAEWCYLLRDRFLPNFRRLKILQSSISTQ